MVAGLWGLGRWGLDPWGIGGGVPPTITPLYPKPNADDVLPSTYLTFVVADLDTTISLANTTVTVNQEVTPGVWVADPVYAAAAFIGAWVAESTTAAYTGALGTGFTFSCRQGATTWDNDTRWRIDVVTQDVDVPAPHSKAYSWYFTSIESLYVSTLEQLDRRTLRITFSNQLADTTTAAQNGRPQALQVLSYSDYIYAQQTGREGRRNQVQVKNLNTGADLLPNQMLVHTTQMEIGERYCIVPGSLSITDWFATLTWTPTAADLVDMFTQNIADLVDTDFEVPLFLEIQQTKMDQLAQRMSTAGFDMSERSRASSVFGAIGLADDQLGGSGTRRSVSR